MGLLDIDTELTKLTRDHLKEFGFDQRFSQIIDGLNDFYRKDIIIIKPGDMNMHCIALAQVVPSGIHFKISLINYMSENRIYIRTCHKFEFETEYYEIAANYLEKDYLLDYFKKQLGLVQ